MYLIVRRGRIHSKNPVGGLPFLDSGVTGQADRDLRCVGCRAGSDVRHDCSRAKAASMTMPNYCSNCNISGEAAVS